jgi:DNA polymerase-3 subunit alpha
VYLSDHPLNEYREVLSSASHTVAQLADLDDRAEVGLVGMLTAFEPRVTKAGRPMARATLEDQTGSVTLLLFPACFEQFGKLLARDRVISVKGRTSLRERAEGEQPALVEVIGEQITLVQPPHSRETNGNGRAADDGPAVHVRISRAMLEDHRLRLLRRLVEQHPGSHRLLLHVADGGRRETLVLSEWRVAGDNGLIDEARRALQVGPTDLWVAQ